jgi:hypothetical protein
VGGTVAMLTMLPQTPTFHPRTGLVGPILERNLVGSVQEGGWAPSPVLTGAENLVPTPANLIARQSSQ